MFFKKNFFSEHKLPQPTNADLREFYEKLISKRQIKGAQNFEKALIARKIRTQSGIAVIAVLTKPYPCPGKCLYCPTEKSMPKSYLANEPAVMRAIASKFNPYLQVQNRLRSLELNGHNTDKIELIIMGGTFSYFPKNYQKRFIAECFRACNEYPKNKTRKRRPKNENDFLATTQAKNEKAPRRIVGLTLETRPDYIDEKEIVNFRKLGCTRVELGVQSIFDQVLKINKRGHNVQQTIKATQLLKNAGFKINYHVMPGLPGSNLKKDYAMFRELFCNSDFQPDMLKIYPAVVLKNSALYHLWKKREYQPLTDKKFESFILRVKNNLIRPYARIARLVRDIPTPSIVAGPTLSNLRQVIAPRSKCPCIRCREVRENYGVKEKIVLDRIDYDASGGREIFLQYVSSDKKKLFALLRLRVPDDKNKSHYIPVLRNAALIREVHTYGKIKPIENKRKKQPLAALRFAKTAGPQHTGLGQNLMREAERIAKEEFGFSKIAVISGIGVRDYYRKNGYQQKETYMAKEL